METSAIPGWNDFFVATSGVAGALAGLLFVALSINLERIIKQRSSIGRAAEALILLASALSIALIALVPAQTTAHLGALFLVAAIPAWIIPLTMQLRALRHREFARPQHFVARVLIHELSILPILGGAFGLAGIGPGVVGWVATGCIICMIAAMLNAWVLLVEILR